MKERDLPQDESFYAGHLRACYVLDENGEYKIATSRGWEVETVATAQAIEELDRVLEQVRHDVSRGLRSALAYHMTARQMTPAILAKHMGIATWRVRRHLRPAQFVRLSDRMLRRYAACLDVPPADLRRIPEVSDDSVL